MRRRAFIAGLGATVTLSRAAEAQQSPVIGFLGVGTLEEARVNFAGGRRGLAEAGYVEGRNLSVEFRCADYHSDRLPALAADLVQRQVAAIIAPSGPAISAARAATKSISVIFFTGFDPVASGFVDSLNRPGGNVTGIFTLNPQLLIKRLELLHELVPAAKSIALLFSPTAIASAESALSELKAAAGTLGVELVFRKVDEPGQFEEIFEKLSRENIDAILLGSDAVLSNNRDQLVALAARHGIPAIYPIREFAEAGGLLSYGTDYPDAYRQVGVYAGRVLKGKKPSDLPIQQITRIELVINMKTAKALGLTFPLSVLGRADSVIE
jgi:ABC-type uncharacterized transport system substrate-binding protein